MFLHNLYEQLPDEVRTAVSLDVVTRYVLQGDPPFLPGVLGKIRKRNTAAGHEIAVTFHALRVLAYEQGIKDEETLEKFWHQEINTVEVHKLTRMQRIKRLFKRT